MQKNYGVKFLGYGAALPSRVVKNTDLENLFDTSDEWIFTRTGIKERRVLAENENGLTLASKAAKDAISKSGIEPGDIDLIIVSTCTPDKLYPSMSCMLQAEIGAVNAVCFDLSAACSGYVFGIVTASQFIYTGLYKNILVVGVDVHSRFLDWTERSVSILFGDGAGAVVMKQSLPAEDELVGFVIKSKTDKDFDLVLDNTNTSFVNFSKSKTSNFVSMNGKAIFQFALSVVPQVINELLDKINFSKDDFDYLILHQANQRIIDSVSHKLNMKKDKVISSIQNVGNTSAASIPLAIVYGLDSKIIKIPSTLLLAGFGAGLTWGAVMIKCTVK